MKIRYALIAILAALFAGTAWAAQPPGAGKNRFDVDAVSMGKKRHVKKERRAAENRPKYPSGSKWEIRRSTATGRARTDCLFARGEKRFCRHGGIANAFESSDGRRVLTYSSGGTIESPAEKAITIFDTDTGEKIRDVPVAGTGSSLVGVADARADLFVTYYQAAGGSIILHAFDMAGNEKWHREIKSRITPQIGTESIAISGDGKNIFLATIPVSMETGQGSVFVITDSGDIKKELPVGSCSILLNPAKTLAVFYNRQGYKLYSIADDEVITQESCASGRRDWCLVKGFSPDGRFLVVVGLEQDSPADKSVRIRLVRTEVVDVAQRKIHRDILNEEFGNNVQAEFKTDGSVEVQSTEKTISYEAIP